MARLATESQRADGLGVTWEKHRKRVATGADCHPRGGGLARIDHRIIERAMAFKGPNGTGANSASGSRRNRVFKLADNELADLILKTRERDRWLYDYRRGLFFAGKTWDWALDPEMAALGRRLKELAEEEARNAGKRLELRYSTLRGAMTMVQHVVEATPEWDGDPMIAGLPGGGVLDLRTGKPRPSKREEFVSRSLGIMPDASGPPTRFLQFLDEMTGRQPDVVAWLLRYFGYLLTGHTVSHVALFLLGDAAAGKSTLVELLTHVLGDYGARVPPDALVAKRGSSDRHPEWMTALDGARFTATAEMPATGARLRTGLFKTLTGGDTIRANRMRRDGYSFKPTAKLLMYGNSVPEIPGADSGLRRRLVVLPCLPATECDERLLEVLRSEAGGILAWMARAAAAGCQRHERGDGWLQAFPVAMQSATRELFEDHDPLGQALDDLSVFGQPQWFAPTEQIRVALTEYYRREGLGAVPSHRQIAQRLRGRGCTSEKRRGVRGWKGVALGDSLDSSS